MDTTYFLKPTILHADDSQAQGLLQDQDLSFNVTRRRGGCAGGLQAMGLIQGGHLAPCPGEGVLAADLRAALALGHDVVMVEGTVREDGSLTVDGPVLILACPERARAAQARLLASDPAVRGRLMTLMMALTRDMLARQ